MKTSIQPRFRTIDGLTIRFAEGDDRGEDALPMAFTVFRGEILQVPQLGRKGFVWRM